VLSVLRFAIVLVPILPFAIARPEFLRYLWSLKAAILGFTGVSIYYSFANIGMLFTTAGTAALLSALVPVFTAGFAMWLLRERLTVRSLIGLALATVGVALSASPGLRLDLGVDLMLLALAGYALGTPTRKLTSRWSGRIFLHSGELPTAALAAFAPWDQVHLARPAEGTGLRFASVRRVDVPVAKRT
jgi:drug/metabolite transporter (DMT)-like permease